MRHYSLLAVGAILSIVTSRASAQALPDGQWTAQLVKENGDARDYLVEVKRVRDSLTMHIMAGPVGGVPFEKVRQSGDTLRFGVPAASGVAECTLQRLKNGNFRGPCVSADGVTSELTLKPPAPALPKGGEPGPEIPVGILPRR